MAPIRSMVPADLMIEMLSRRARELTYGMNTRVNRLPDIADFKAAFENELLKYVIVKGPEQEGKRD